MQPQPVTQPSSNRKPLLIGAVVAVVVIIGIVLAFTLGKSDSGVPGAQPGMHGAPIGSNQPATNPEAEKVYDAALTGLADPDKFQTFLETTAIQSLKDTIASSTGYEDVVTDSTRCYLFLRSDGRTASSGDPGVVAVLCAPGSKGGSYSADAMIGADGVPVVLDPPQNSTRDRWDAAARTSKGVSPYGFWPMAG